LKTTTVVRGFAKVNNTGNSAKTTVELMLSFHS